MKINLRNLMVASLCAMSAVAVWADSLVLLHTNDTHSMIFPDKDGLGGVQRRKVLIDSVRNAEKNVVLIDAGDAEQGVALPKMQRNNHGAANQFRNAEGRCGKRNIAQPRCHHDYLGGIPIVLTHNR